MARHRRSADHRRRHPPSGRSRTGHQPQQRPAGDGRAGEFPIQHLLHLRSVSDHRPFFAIPRCASTSFTVGIEPLLGENVNATVLLAAFSCVFFAAVLFFSLRPGKILTWVGSC